jgi:CHAT domain-containing protein/tetratricopeptide (TPR) repeat protein
MFLKYFISSPIMNLTFVKYLSFIIFLFRFLDGICVSDSSQVNFEMAMEAFEQKRYIEAEEKFRKSFQNVHPDSINELIFQLHNYGSIKMYLNKLDEGMDIFQKILDVIDSAKIAPPWLFKVYGNIGLYHLRKGEYEHSINFHKKSLEKISDESLIDSTTLLIINFNIGLSYKILENFNLAEKYFQRSLSYLKNENSLDAIYSLLTLANMHASIKNVEKSNYYFNKIFKVIDNHGDNHPYLFEVFYDYAQFLIENEKNDLAFKYYQMAFKKAFKYYGFYSSKSAKSYLGIGKYYAITRKHMEAIRSYQLALHALLPSFTDTLGYSNPTTIDINDKLLYIEILKSKAASLLELGLQKPSHSTLSLSAQTYRHCTAVLDHLKISYLTSDGKLFLAEKEKGTFLQALDAAYKSYQLTHDATYLKHAFFYVEKIKSSILIASLRENDALNMSGIPSGLLEKESNLKRDISVYEGLVYNEMKSVEVDQQQLDYFKNTVFDLKNEYERLKNKFEKEYPDYYHLKYDTRVTSVEKIQKSLDRDQVMLEYALNDSVIFVFYVSKKDFQVKRLPLDTSFMANLLRFQQLTGYSNGWEVWENTSLHDFISSGNYLFNVLIGPFRQEISGKRIIIVPDELVGGLPFEILLDQAGPAHEMNFRDLPFLISTNPIAYAFSSTLLFEHEFEPSNNNRVLCMAPEYNNTFRLSNPEIRLRNIADSILKPLPGAQKEARVIAEMMGGDFFAHSHATESNFKLHSGKYKVLHMAAHTLIDNKKPLYSKIVFSPDSLGEDGMLNTFELYNLKLNAEMVFLSACQSGFGKVQKGEGVLSLARGFTYAGCRSIAFTLWDLDDRSTSAIVVDFYRSLAKGMHKDVALQKAKLSFLENADQVHQHPWFWAGIVITGDPQKMFYNRFWAMAGILAFLVPALAFGFIKTRKAFYNRGRK